MLLASPLRRTRESAEILGERLGVEVVVDEGLVEAGFGSWEGLTYAEVRQRDPETFARWMQDVKLPAGGHGDSLSGFDARMRRSMDRLLSAYAGRTVVAATHLTPIKVLVRQALQMPLASVFRTEVAPGLDDRAGLAPRGAPRRTASQRHAGREPLDPGRALNSGCAGPTASGGWCTRSGVGW